MKIPLSEKWRPKEFNEVIGVARIEEIKKIVSDPMSMPNLLFFGTPGVGKTTVARIVLEKLKPIDVLKINGSDTTGVDNIRDKVYNFMSSMSSERDKPKIVWVEEMDFMCLDPETEIIIGTMDNNRVIKIKDVPEEGCSIISYNIITRKIENDWCTPLPTSEKDVYTIELEDGRIIEATMEHPFFIEQNGELIEKKLKDLKENDVIIDVSDEI